MRRILIVFAALLGIGMTSLAALALSQSEQKIDPKDSVVRQAPAMGDFVVPVDSLLARLAAKRAVIEVDNQWRVGELLNNAALLDGLLADDWTTTGTGFGSKGLDRMVETKAHYLADVKSGQRSYESIVDDESGVYVYGDTAVVTGRTTSKGYLNDELIAGTSRFTRTYAKRGGQWQMVASYLTLMIPS